MKYLYLIRHAKASWEDANLQDFDRPLTPVGEEDAKTMALALKKQKAKPDLIIASPALRSIKTAEIMAEEFSYPLKKIKTEMLIYNGGVEDMVELIKHIDSKINTAFYFGHNPSLTWLTHYLCDSAKMNIPTCGVVGISFNMKTWPHISDAETKLITFLHPDHEQITGAL